MMWDDVLYVGVAIAVLSLWLDVKIAIILIIFLYLFFKRFKIIKISGPERTDFFERQRALVESELVKLGVIEQEEPQQHQQPAADLTADDENGGDSDNASSSPQKDDSRADGTALEHHAEPVKESVAPATQ